MFKVWHDLCPPTVKNLFSLKSSTYNFRGADFHIPRFNSVTYGKHSDPKIYWTYDCGIDLKITLKNLLSLQSFKKQICLINLLSKIEHQARTVFYVVHNHPACFGNSLGK